MNKLLDTLAYGISGLSSPFIVALIIPISIIYMLAVTYTQFLLFGGLFILFVSVIPLLFIIWGVRRGIYSDVHLKNKEQRFMPFIFITISISFLAFVYFLLQAPPAIMGMTVALAMIGIIYLGVTKYWKISMHSGFLSGCITSLALLVNLKYFLLFLLMPFVIWARMHRGRHNLAQGVAGAALVCLSTYLILKIMRIK